MGSQYIRIFVMVLALLFLSSCAVFVRDEDWHHHRHGYRHYSSLQQSDQSTGQMTAQNSGDAGGP